MMKIARFGFVLALLWPLATACLAETASVTGQVVDQVGKPVVRARVRAVLVYSVVESAEVKQTAESGADGFFTLSDLPLPPQAAKCDVASQWRYYLVADTQDGRFGWTYYSPEAEKRALPRSYTPTVRLNKLDTVEGRVVDQNGKGVSGAVVRPAEFRGREGTLGQPAIEQIMPMNVAVTNADGAFRLEGVPEKTICLFDVEKSGLAQKGPDKPGGTTIAMMPGGSIGGRVVDAGGKPVAGVKVVAAASYSQPGDPPGALINRGFYAGRGTATTGLDGSYVIRALGTHRFDVLLSDSSDLLAPMASGIDVKAAETAHAPDLVASKGVLISGHLNDADTGEPVAGACVTASGPAQRSQRRAVTDPSGAYGLLVLPGRATVRYTGGNADYLLQWDRNVEVLVPAEGLTGVDVLIRRAEVARGTVVDESGSPVGKATVDLSSPDHYGSSYGTDAKGAFSIRVNPPKPDKGGVPYRDAEPGMVAVRAATKDKSAGVTSLVKREDLLTGDLVLTVHPARTLTVTVTDPSGKPVSGILVSLSAHSGQGHSTILRPTTDTAGRVRIAGFYVGDRNSLRLTKSPSFASQAVELPQVGSPEWNDSVDVVWKPDKASMVTTTISRALPLREGE